MRDMEIDDAEVERSDDNWRFRLERTLYISKEKVKFPVLMKTDGDSFIKKDVTVNVIESDEVTFLCGEETLVDWNTTLYFSKRRLGFDEDEKEVVLIKESHLLVRLEQVGGRKIPRAEIEEEQPQDRGEDLVKNIRGWADLVKNSGPNNTYKLHGDWSY